MRPSKVVTVVIPSIGRNTLIEVLNSIALDFQWVAEVIIVDDSKNGFEKHLLKEIRDIPNLNLRVVRPMNHKGAGNARNVGLDNASTPWIAFADDDDPWYQNRLEIQMPILEVSQLNAAVFLDDKGHTRKEIWDGTVDPLLFLYGDRGFIRHRRFIPFGTLIYKREIYEKVRFDIELTEREDLWFFHTMYQTDRQFRQLPFPGCKVTRNVFRSARRPALDSDIEWFERLRKIETRIAFNFAIYVVLRNALLTFDFKKTLALLRNMKSLLSR